ncbi:TonB-dependent receptor plug domain-containing protein [Methylomonas sp. 2BW1-5-20]|uniref:TonB-dependent receptor plug domain-containing protein n=1 Tax=Methylomonas sp. 2BW1-5-20 TaxID=3376686 RepID=UPI004050D764
MSLVPSYLLLAVTLLALPRYLHAEEDAQAAEAGDEQSLLFGELPSVFSASRHEQPITKAPAAVDIISSEQIKRYGWRTVAAMLGSLPGFLNTYDRAYNHVGVRGFAPPGDYNTRILVLIDGHRVNESLQDYAGLGRDFLVDVENIERVEVVRGPASSLYGSSAVFAVVNVITQRGRDLQGARLGSEVASYDSHQGQVSYGQKFTNGMEGLLSASVYHSDGHHTLNYGDLGNVNNLDGEQVERLFGKLAWGDFTLSGAYLQRKKSIPAGSVGADLGVQGSHYHDRRAYADLNYRHTFSNDWELTGRLFWDGYEFDDDLNSINAAQLLTNQDYWQGNWFGGEVLLSHTFFESHRLTLGSEYRRNYHQQMLNYDIQPYQSWANNNLNSSIAGIFLQDEWSLLDNLSLHAGVRYDRYDNFGDTANPRLGLIYQPFADTTVKLLYGTAFRAPNAFESVYTCCQGAWLGNPALNPERIESYEIVLEQKLNEYLDLRLSPYYNQLSDLINQVSDNGITQFRNLGNAEAHGLETQLQGRFRNFEGRFSYTYQQTRIAGADKALNSPTHMLKLNISAPLWQDKLFASIETQYVSTRAGVGGSSANDYVLTNLIVFSRKWLPGVELSGGIYNLFEEDYADPRFIPPNSSKPLPSLVPQDGRNFRLRLGLEF